MFTDPAKVCPSLHRASVFTHWVARAFSASSRVLMYYFNFLASIFSLGLVFSLELLLIFCWEKFRILVLLIDFVLRWPLFFLFSLQIYRLLYCNGRYSFMILLLPADTKWDYVWYLEFGSITVVYFPENLFPCDMAFSN